MTDERNENTVAYFCGKYFDSEEEMLEYAKKWPDLPVDLKYYRDFLFDRENELELNVSMRPMTNRQAFLLLRCNTDWAAVGETKEENT